MDERPARRKWIACCAASVAAAAAMPTTVDNMASGTVAATHAAPPGWTLSLDEGFDTLALDTSTWTTCYWWDNGGCTNSANSELQWYLPHQIAVGHGALRLRAEPRRVEASDGNTYDFVSGMVTTGRPTHDVAIQPGFAFTYAHIEIRAVVPAGTGLWPAFWLLPATHEPRPEIDMMELRGGQPDHLLLHVHYLDDGGERQSLGEEVEVADLSDGWHTFSLTWSADELVWGLDGAVVWRVAQPDAVPQEPMYLLANLAVGGDFPGPPSSETAFPADMLIDFVRIWMPPGTAGT